MTFSRQFLAGLMQLGQVLIVARLLGPEGAGAFAIALLLPTMLSQLFNLGLNSANVYLIASRQFLLGEAWAASRDAMAVMGLVGLSVGVVVILNWGETLFPGIAQTVLLSAMLIYPTSLIAGVVAGLFQSLQDFRAFNLTVLVQPTLALLGITVLWMFKDIDLMTVINIVVVSHALALSIALLLLSRKTPLAASGAARMTYLRIALVYGLKAHLANLLSFLNYRLDLFLVNLIAGPASTGLYTVAVRLAEQLWMISQAVSTVIFPRLSAMLDDKISRDYFTAMMARCVLWITLTAATVLSLIASPLIVLLFGADFQDAAFALLLLIPGIVLYSCARVLANSFAASGRVGINLWLSIVVLIVNTFANLALIPKFGIAGAAAATTLAYCLTLMVYLVLQQVINKQHWRNFILPTKVDLMRLRQFVKKGKT